MSKKYLITGAAGQLGYDIIRELNSRGIYDILAPTIEEMDITNKEEVEKIICGYKPDYVIHCAAYTQVDKAEDEVEVCYDVNAKGTKNIVEACKKIDATLTYISTDYVFDGTKDGIYEPDDKTNPISIYGKTKCLGEEVVREYDKHFIIRISWVFGINGKNFVKTMLRLAETRNEINVVSDQIGSPTYTVDLSKLIADMQDSKKYGTYQATNENYCSWAEFADYIFKSNNIDCKVNAIPTNEYPTKATRPMNSKMSKQKLIESGFELLPTWQDAIDRYNLELKKEKTKKLV